MAEPRGTWTDLGLPAATVRALKEPDDAAIAGDLDWLKGQDRHLLTCLDPDFPPRLNDVPGGPAALFIVGDPACLRSPQIAIVGSRNPSADGKAMAGDFAAHLAAAGLTVTSGLALGVDGCAHRGALKAGGRSIAVMGTGPDRVYPAAHKALAHELADHGAVVTEFPPGVGPRAEHFPRRNRIISALSLGVLVVEAARQSGSLITARLAVEQGRDVFAIPGSIHNPMARGCHALIRDGARLVESADDILSELHWAAHPVERPSTERDHTSPPALEIEYTTLLEALGYAPVSVDSLVQRTGLTADVVSSMLLILELRGLVAAGAGGRYSRSPLKDS